MSHPSRNLHLLIGLMQIGRPCVCRPILIQHADHEHGAHLHLGVDHTRVLPLPVDVVHLSQVILLAEGRVEDVVEVDGQDVQETGGP